ncbi:MAG: glycosyltransferase family 9 protein [Patescibacteria group bacterium]
MAIYKCAWFINFTGIGNGVTIAPLLRCFEKSYPTTEYFHTENEILSNGWFVEKARLSKLKGFSPIAWRRFNKEDWDKIVDFVNQNQIDLIVNLRNEGPRYDTGYYEFKKFLKQDRDIIFWDLDFNIIENRKKQENLTGDLLKMFQQQNVSISYYEPRWLATNSEDKSEVGFGMAASQKNKRWPTHKWVELAQKILKNTNIKIILFHGLSQEEVDGAVEVQKVIGLSRCEMINHQELNRIAIMLGKLKCFISNDSGLLHICSATGTPTVGLYTNTDPDIWAPYDKANFLYCTNIFMEKCLARKIYCGNCFHYYGPCPAIIKYGDSISPKQVFELVKEIIA